MPAIDFPASPSVNDEYSFEGRTWLWNGTGWEVKSYPAALQLGSASAPSLYFTGDPNTGLYSPGADQVAISTGGTGRLFVDSSGQVKIGLNTGTDLLDVVADSTSVAGARITNINTNSSTGARLALDSAGGSWYITNQRIGAPLVFDNGTERLRITSAGNVGIGTSSPVQLLHINTTGTSAILRVSSGSAGVNTSTSSIQLSSSFSGSGVEGTAQINANAPAGGQSELAFLTSSSGNSPTERLRITSDGKVGIGTSSPGNLLTVTGTATNVALAYFVGTDADNSNGIEVKAGGVNSGKYIGSFRDAADNIRFHILADGKVGIGTSSPQASLHCSGAILASSSLAALSASNIFIDQPTSALSRIGVAGADSSTAGTLAISQYSSNGSVGRDVIQISASGTTTLTSAASTAPFIAKISTSEVARIDSSGRLLVGTSTAGASRNIYGGLELEQSQTGNNAWAHFTQYGNSYTNRGARLYLNFTLGTSAGSATAVTTEDELGAIHFRGANGTTFQSAAEIRGETDTGTISGTSMPGRLVFSTTADGAASPTERLRITSDGKVGIGTSSPAAQLSVSAAANSETIRIGIAGGISTINGDYVTLASNAKSFGNTADFQNILANAAVGLGVISPMRSPVSATVGGVWVATGNATANTTYAWSSMTPALTWNTSGQVGIGTTSPATTLDVNGDVTITDKIIHSGDTNTAIRFPADDVVAIETAGSERARIDSSGRLLVGTSAAIEASVAPLQVAQTSGPGIALWHGSATGTGANVGFYKTRATTVGAYSILSSGDRIGRFDFFGDDGTDIQSIAARIDVAVDGTPALNDMPGRLVFSTTLDGAASPTEAFRITNDRVRCYNQADPAAVNTTATLTVANLKTGIITSTTAAAVTMTLPTGTDTEAGFSGIYTNMTFEWSVINTGATNAVTVQGGTGHTLVGSGTVAASNSGRFASRRTAANTFVTYRLSS